MSLDDQSSVCSILTCFDPRDADVQRAIQLSEQEASERTKAVEDANSRSLFDDGLQV